MRSQRPRLLINPYRRCYHRRSHETRGGAMNSETARTEIKVWAVNKDDIKFVEETSFASEHLEKHLERWLEQSPDLLGRDLLIIGRQVSTTSGPLDLLAIDALGALYIIELKRSMLPREAVIQALDYASWLHSTTTDEIFRIAEAYLKGPLDDTFQDRFGVRVPDITPQNHKILVVGMGLDAGAERLIAFLSQRYSVQINAVFFKYIKVGGKELLIRSLLVPEALAELPSRRRRAPSELLEIAKRRGAESIVEILRSLSSASGAITETDEYVSEQPARTYGGAFRYWRKDLGGAYKMVFGVNVTDQWGAHTSEVDVWIRPHEVAQVTGLSPKKVDNTFAGLRRVQSRPNRWVIRVKNEKEAQKLVTLLKNMFEAHPGSYQSES